MTKKIIYVLFPLLLFACDFESEDNSETNKKDNVKRFQEIVPKQKDGTAAPETNTKFRITKILADGTVSDKFHYKDGRLHKWEGELLQTLVYTDGKISKIEVWEDTYDGLEKVGEKIYTYQADKLKKIKEFELDEGERSATYRVELDYKGGKLAETRVFDLFEGKTLDVRSVYYYDGDAVSKIENYNDEETPYERIEFEYSQVVNPYWLAAKEIVLDDYELIMPLFVKLKKATKLPKERTLTESWKNTIIENGILKKGVLTLPRRGKPINYEFIYDTK